MSGEQDIDDLEDEDDVVESPNIPGRALPLCFHLPGQYANKITNSDGELIMFSKEVRLIDEPDDSPKNYYHYVVRCSPTEHHCIICSEIFKTSNNGSTNIINKHIKRRHPEVIPFNFMSMSYVNDAVSVWENAESKKDVKKRKAAPVQEKPVQEKKKVQVQTSISSSFLSPAAIVQAVLYAIVLGYLPLDFINNAGLRFLLIFFIGASVKLPLGLSARSLGRRLKEMHDNFIKETKVMLTSFLPPVMDYDPCGLQRTLSCQQDGWGTRDGKSHHLGFCLDFIDIVNGVWTKVNYPLCAEPFEKDATAANNMELIEEVLVKFGIGAHNLTSCTQDSTPSSFNTFDNIDSVAQLMCMAHVLALLIKWSVEKCDVLDAAIEACQKVASLIKGKGSSKRRKLHEQACKEANIKYRRIIAGGPKWGG